MLWVILLEKKKIFLSNRYVTVLGDLTVATVPYFLCEGTDTYLHYGKLSIGNITDPISDP